MGEKEPAGEQCGGALRITGGPHRQLNGAHCAHRVHTVRCALPCCSWIIQAELDGDRAKRHKAAAEAARRERMGFKIDAMARILGDR